MRPRPPESRAIGCTQDWNGSDPRIAHPIACRRHSCTAGPTVADPHRAVIAARWAWLHFPPPRIIGLDPARRRAYVQKCRASRKVVPKFAQWTRSRSEASRSRRAGAWKFFHDHEVMTYGCKLCWSRVYTRNLGGEMKEAGAGTQGPAATFGRPGLSGGARGGKPLRATPFASSPRANTHSKNT